MSGAAQKILGNMQVANEQIRIVETKVPEDVLIKFLARADPSRDIEPPNVIDITWFAFAPLENQPIEDETKYERIVGYASLERSGKDDVVLRWVVDLDYRSMGVGKLLARFATDQAIHYRMRTISAFTNNEVAIRILEAEMFEPVPPEINGRIHMKKVLKWQ